MYTGTIDGRILKYNKFRGTFEDFAYTSPDRTNAYCDGTTDIGRSHICGFPKTFSTDKITGKIYVIDSNLGLSEVGFSGGLATTLVPSRDGVPYHLLLGVDAATNRKVYFTDGSSIYGLKDLNVSVVTGDSSGKLLEYDTRTKVVTELLTGLAGPAGVVSDPVASYLLVSEFTGKRIRKYYIKGPKAGTSEVILTFLGNPDVITRIKGEENFWVAVNNPSSEIPVVPLAIKFSSAGEVLAMLQLVGEFKQRITIVFQQGNQLFVAGLNVTYIVKYNLEYS
ncbi:OLC1v1014013C2 [Oldenlandia corymbosa var. corymbosa]|nr:OLC1v1014013C2 [Oldenlandia corymbosa var. corymbosa]